MRRSPGDPGYHLVAPLRIAGIAFLLCANLHPAAQQVSAAPSSGSSQEPATEMAVKDQSTPANIEDAAKLRVNVRLVLARVVVRDSSGHAVGGLHKEDFEIFDNGKKQVISNFDAQSPINNLEKTTSKGAIPPTASSENTDPGVFPGRYVAYLFDDLFLDFGNLARVRDAALKRIAILAPADRVAVFTTSGQSVLDFTDDRAKLTQVISGLRPHPSQGKGLMQCPLLTFYMADMIINKNDANVLQTAVNDYIACARLPQQAWSSAAGVVQGMASQLFNVSQEDSRMALRVINDVVRRMAPLPGQRSLVLVSPGFLTPQLEYDYGHLIDKALHEQVVISSLDARGLYVIVPGGDASEEGRPEISLPGQTHIPESRALLEINSASTESEILSVLAYSTGGVFFQNNNDMDEGFRRVSDSPEFYYILGFTPQNLKTDGKFHNLKVGLTTHQKYDIQTRRGYYAPRHNLDAAEEAKHEIEDEVFSNEELHDLPVALHTEFFKPSDDSAKLTVLARVDVKRLHYKQSSDRNTNDLTVVTAVFDRNGNFLQADQKLVQMRWKGQTLQAKLGSGITLKTSFDVKPGRYLVRVVARDSEQQVMSAENGAVEIP